MKIGSTEPYIGIILQNSSLSPKYVIIIIKHKLYNKSLHIKFYMQLKYQVGHFKMNLF